MDELTKLKQERDFWQRAWQEQREATGKSWWQGFRAGLPKEDRGKLINQHASLGAEIVRLEAAIPELEKLARKTPPKTLLKEWEKVKSATVLLNKANTELEAAKLKRAEVRGKLVVLKHFRE